MLYHERRTSRKNRALWHQTAVRKPTPMWIGCRISRKIKTHKQDKGQAPCPEGNAPHPSIYILSNNSDQNPTNRMLFGLSFGICPGLCARASGFVQNVEGGSLTLPPSFRPLFAPALPIRVISRLLPAPGNQPGNPIEIPFLLSGNRANALCLCENYHPTGSPMPGPGRSAVPLVVIASQASNILAPIT